MAETLPPLDIKHHHTAISVSDLDEAVAWYSNTLGFELEYKFPLPHIKAEAAVVRRGPMRVEIFAVQDAAPLPEGRRQPDTDPQTHGNKHMCYAVRDTHQALEALKARGVDIAQIIPTGGDNIAIYARDPFGNLMEFVQQPDLWD